MKKPKLDLSKVKTLLVQHVEKILFGFFVFLFLFFTYKGFTLEKYDKTPTDLQNEVQRATTHVSSSKFDAKREGMVFVDPTTTVAQNVVQIDAAAFPLAPMNPPDFPPANKRGEPQYLPVEDLQVSASFGTFQVNQAAGQLPGAPAAGVGFAAKRWVCVTGLIPYERQRRLYHEQFAKRGGGDPEWVAYRIERAELDNAPGAEPVWKVVSLAEAAAQQKQWGAATQEIVPEEFRVPQPKGKSVPMLYPLGPRVGSTWTPEEVNHPKILAIIAAETPPGARPAAGGAAAVPGAVAGAAGGAENADLAGGAAVPVAAPVEADVFDPEAAPAPAAPANKPAAAVAVKQPRENRLFRFFDFGVVPGKRYQYRVMLYLTNPNLGKEARDLTDAKLAVGPYRTTLFSAPSPAITVPHDSGVLLVGHEAAKGATEAGVVVIAQQLTDQGATALAKRTVRRGEEVNFRATPADLLTIVKPGGNANVERPAQFDIRTDTLVVDLLLGANAAGGADARALMLGPDGRLVVKTVAGNAAAVAKAQLDLDRGAEAAPPEEPAEGDAAKADKDKKDKKEERKRGGATPGGNLIPSAGASGR